jgi:hypothetical protein
MQPPESATSNIYASMRTSKYLVSSTTSPGQSDRLSSLDILGPSREGKRVVGVGDSNEGSRDGEDTGEMHSDGWLEEKGRKCSIRMLKKVSCRIKRSGA